MHLTKPLIIIIAAIFYCFPLAAQIKNIKLLEEEVTKQNDALRYENSIKLISDFISDESKTSYEKYNAYILKSYTYKRLFNYEETLHNLDLALKEGLKSDKKATIENCIKAEKAFVYFDTHEYALAGKLMQELYASNYKYLDQDSKTWIIMQEGYLLMMKKKYAEADKKYDVSLAIALKNTPRNAPNIYGKKVELYNVMKLYDKRDKAFEIGMQYAKKYKILKYEMYLYEVITKQFRENDDYKNAFESQKKYDSLNSIYNSTNNNGKIQILEKKIDEEKKQLELKNERIVQYYLIGIVSILILLLIISGRLYVINKQKRVLVENENIRIHNDIEQLTKAIDEKGNKRLDISKFHLTERQKEIICLIQEGKSNKEIAILLFISENTVKYHLKIIYEILDIEHRTEIK
ncbi:response regulator transcription factor [Flavobacterium sp.]|uniref:response regulator transcription factor n=1 Tax=Flavobacterium sp. TaxID=239 RepID=UPI003750CC3D